MVLDKLKLASWSGIPLSTPHIRAEIWSLLSDYMPIDKEVKIDTLVRKREEYVDQITYYFHNDASIESTVDSLNKTVDGMSQYESKQFR